MRTTWTFHSAGQLIFGRDAVSKLSEVVSRDGFSKFLVVTDGNLAKAGIVDKVRESLQSTGSTVTVFDGGEPEPSLEMIERCIGQAQEVTPDAVVGLGGGSNMDAAKLTATVLAHGGSPRDYAGDDKIPGPIKPLICVPTTAGTGSEVSGAAVFTDTEQEIKIGVLSNYLRPSAAVVDPMLTISCPPKVTADSGIDALTHAIEAYTAVDNAVFPLPEGERSIYQGKHPFGDMLAEKAIISVGRFLRRAVRDGTDIEAREGMALAATLAGLAFSNVGVALVHAMEYPVGGATHCSHGAGNGLLLPYVMRFNLPSRERQFADIARWLGEDIDGLDEHAAAEKAIGAVEALRADIGIPNRLRELGATEDQLPTFTEKAYAIQRVLRVNPRFPTVEEVEEIFRQAL